ncbi:IclR family transcriptional regulator [Ammoniphilus sp. YIM 78166]|uniref:IclR family transcriptional regulator n=1 Tax=Ammoniphilus sp. YIM 78166 TaxID=1644106 RepID=UPI00106F808A|nr:IclR family transcriptional regulator [Ammoniphilus sp. YIM 78166]
MPIIQAVERALDILDLFKEHETELKITDISQRMNLNKSTVHSLLKTLQVRGYIEQNTKNGRYKLGLKLFERGNFVIHGMDIQKISKSYLVELSRKSGKTTHLAVLDGKEVVYMDQVEGTMEVMLYSRIGSRFPVHCTAAGKVLVAFRIPEERSKILDGYVYQKLTGNTVLSEEEFLQELNHVCEVGYAIDNQENEPSIYCIAVPIRDWNGEVIAAIGMSTLVSRVDDHKLHELLKLFIKAGEQISAQMGYGSRLS